jgi:unsaturated rhamnogalacturonyl hydrolase
MSDVDELSERVIGRLLATQGQSDCDDHFTIERWEWPQGVALYALFLRASRDGDEGKLNFLRDWYTRHIAAGLPARNVNTSAPLLALAFLSELDGQGEWLSLCEEWAEWMMNGMPRTEEGGIQHVTSDLVNVGELWADTLFMAVLFLAKMGSLLGRADYSAEAEYQYLLHIKYLVDRRSGLWFHGWSFRERNHFGAVRWARGNSWFTAGAVEFLEIARPSLPVRRQIEESYRAQARALVAVQDGSGLWNTILGDKDSYLESSGSAAIAYGLLKGLRLGYLDESFRASALSAARGVISMIDGTGTVGGVSHGTAIGMNREHYLGIKRSATAYGQGLAYLMLGEYARYIALRDNRQA